MIDASPFLPFANRLADAARAAIAVASRDLGDADNKSARGYDPVTEADRAAERTMRALIETEHPGHAISGEEYGERSGDGPWRWSLDPIDGTRAFVCGLPGWTVLIALLHEDRPVLGVIDVPTMGERYVGTGTVATRARGGKAEALRTSGCVRLGEARLATTDPYLFRDGETGDEGAAWERVRGAVRLARYGYDAYAYARLAAGSIDLVIENNLQPHDLNALIPVVRAAGGMAGNWRGEDEFSEGKLVAAASETLFNEAVARLAG